VIYVCIGSLAGDLARLGAGATAAWVLYGVGLAAAVSVTRVARRALAKKVA